MSECHRSLVLLRESIYFPRIWNSRLAPIHFPTIDLFMRVIINRLDFVYFTERAFQYLFICAAQVFIASDMFRECPKTKLINHLCDCIVGILHFAFTCIVVYYLVLQ